MTVQQNELSSSLISICIPTYKRPALLAEALDSCFAQTYRDFEIVIGDDSPDAETEQLIQRYQVTSPDQVRYVHHRPSLGQNQNVNELFARARGRRLLLLHDDDMLLPESLAQMAELWERAPELQVVFGKQLLVDHDGSLRPQVESDALNARYFRTAHNAGLQNVPIAAGIRRMFPNDGFLILTDLARAIGYRPRSEVGDACDTDFGLRLCAQATHVWFLDAFTAKYRLSEESISRGAFPAPFAYAGLLTLSVPSAARDLWVQARRSLAPDAVSGWARLGQSRRAAAIFFSSDYPWRRRLSVRGVYHALLVLRSLLRKARDV